MKYKVKKYTYEGIQSPLAMAEWIEIMSSVIYYCMADVSASVGGVD